MKRPTRFALALAACALLGTSGVAAQEPVAPLRDLVGAKGAGGETEMQNRGYKLAGGVAGRRQLLHLLARADEQPLRRGAHDRRPLRLDHLHQGRRLPGRRATPLPAAGGSGDALQTVCGVETGGKTYRYRCQLRTEGLRGAGLLPVHPDHARQRAQDHLAQERPDRGPGPPAPTPRRRPPRSATARPASTTAATPTSSTAAPTARSASSPTSATRASRIR